MIRELFLSHILKEDKLGFLGISPPKRRGNTKTRVRVVMSARV
jgi:hypothetical protein